MEEALRRPVEGSAIPTRQPDPPEPVSAPVLTAYRLSSGALPLVPASARRGWMDVEAKRFFYRCLPMVIANQAGWFLLTDQAISAFWSGGAAIEDLVVETPDGSPPRAACSHFGFGVLTWSVPYLFRTPPGYNLLVRGPVNSPKHGIHPLEGIVETDWSDATFTMNWKFTLPGHRVTFAAGEPVAMLVPQRRGELEAFRAEIRDLTSVPELQRGYELWAEQRAAFNVDLLRPGSEAVRQGWQKHYFQGVSPARASALEHQTKLHLREFVAADARAAPTPLAHSGPDRTDPVPAAQGICTVFSTDCSEYLGWQSLLLARSHARAAQPGSLVRLVAADRLPPAFRGACATFTTGSSAAADDYPPHNKPYSLMEWMMAGGPREELVLLADPDFLFLRPLGVTARRGAPCAQRIGYLDPAHHRELVLRHCSVPERVQPVGAPVLIHRDDLAALAEPWHRKLCEIRRHPSSREQAGWVAEMWAYCFAAAECGLRHEVADLATFGHEDRDDLPLVHYCYSASGLGGWQFDKRSYRPWTPVPPPPPGTPRAAVALVVELNALAAEMRSAEVPSLRAI